MKMPTENSRRAKLMRFTGRILFLTEDTSLIRAQLEAAGTETKALEDELAERLAKDDLPLMNNISTDEITPGWVCFYYDETLGHYVYVALREGAVKKDEVKNGGFAVVVAGQSKGCGSSRETAPYAEKWAGIQLVIARSIEKIYGQNSQNIGLLTSTDFGLIERIRRGEEIALAEFTNGLDPISQSIVEYGGLFNYNQARLAGELSPPPVETQSLTRQLVEVGQLSRADADSQMFQNVIQQALAQSTERPQRPMNIVEKIIARHAFVKAGLVGVESVKPGDSLFAVA